MTPQTTALNVDCLEYMRTLPDKAFQLAIADPPYGIGATSANFMRKGKQTGKSLAVSGTSYTAKEWDGRAPDQDFFADIIERARLYVHTQFGSFEKFAEYGLIA